MGIIVLLISISLLIAVGFLISFLWNMKSGQYEDTYSPSIRMLFDDKIVNKDKNEKHSTSDSTAKKV
jgi:cbb3-type cytochrome oxidase maturation protein